MDRRTCPRHEKGFVYKESYLQRCKECRRAGTGCVCVNCIIQDEYYCLQCGAVVEYDAQRYNGKRIPSMAKRIKYQAGKNVGTDPQ